jgi:hypothetical protein
MGGDPERRKSSQSLYENKNSSGLIFIFIENQLAEHIPSSSRWIHLFRGDESIIIFRVWLILVLLRFFLQVNQAHSGDAFDKID